MTQSSSASAGSSDGHDDQDVVLGQAGVDQANLATLYGAVLMRTFGVDVLACPRCEGRMRLLAMIIAPHAIARFLYALGVPTDVPSRAPARGPPYWKSQVLR